FGPGCRGRARPGSYSEPRNLPRAGNSGIPVILPIGEFVATRAPDYALEGESGDRERYLVLAHQAGDPFAFTEIVKDHYASLFAHALRKMGDQRSAEDVVQDSLLRAYKGLHSFSGDYNLNAWLHRIVNNVCA